VLAFEGPSYVHGDYFTAQVFSGLFGGGMSSRLFQEIREKRGLCYSIYSSAWGLADTGMINIHTASAAKALPQLIDVVGEELKRVAEDGPQASEVVRAKAQLKAGLLMALESSGARSEQLARHLMIYDRVIDSGELIAKVDAVDAEAVRLFASGLVASAPSVAVVGAGKRSGDLAARAEAAVRG
jgi:predicted Zn-dependent peptidase